MNNPAKARKPVDVDCTLRCGNCQHFQRLAMQCGVTRGRFFMFDASPCVFPGVFEFDPREPLNARGDRESEE